MSLSLKCRQLPRVSPLQVEDDTRPHSDRGQGPGAGAAEAAASCYYDRAVDSVDNVEDGDVDSSFNQPPNKLKLTVHAAA